MARAKQVSDLYSTIDSHERDMVEMLSGLIRIPALGPKNGGDGEMKKQRWLAQYCEDRGFKVEWFNAPDPTVSDKVRPSLVVRVPGKDRSKTLWIMSHIDIVPPGNEADWKTPPYEPVLKDGKLFGRGAEDDCQSVAASFWALKTLVDAGETPWCDVALLFVADEETGSHLGISWLLKAHPKLFRKTDLILVPDSGEPTGELIEVAEKTVLWLKFTVNGTQSHASMPEQGNNSARGVAKLTLLLDDAFRKEFPAKDPLFHPPQSTFEPTKREANVPNVNTIPGKDVFYFDCRVLPQYDPDAAVKLAKRICKAFEKETGLRVDIDTPMHEKATAPTPSDAEVVKRLERAISETRRAKPFVGGIGGGTVAGIFRKAGFSAAVWSTYDKTMHAPNEYAVVKNIVADAKVFLHMMR